MLKIARQTLLSERNQIKKNTSCMILLICNCIKCKLTYCVGKQISGCLGTGFGERWIAEGH